MKKVFYIILSLLGLLLMVFTVLYEINTIHAIIEIPAEAVTIIDYVLLYGSIGFVSLFTLVSFAGKGFFRILFLILTILVLAAGVIAFGFPGLVTQILG